MTSAASNFITATALSKRRVGAVTLATVASSQTAVRNASKLAGRFPNETSALVMVFSLLEEERLKWQKVRMRAEDIAWIEEASKALEQEPIKLEFLGAA